jgi:hypothetical protein
MNTMSLVFSARAEMTKDVFAIVHAINVATRLGDGTGLVKVTMDLAFLEPGFFCDEACVELHFNREVSLEWVQGLVRSVPDTHVFMQTLRPIPRAQNNMERDYNLS